MRVNSGRKSPSQLQVIVKDHSGMLQQALSTMDEFDYELCLPWGDSHVAACSPRTLPSPPSRPLGRFGGLLFCLDFSAAFHQKVSLFWALAQNGGNGRNIDSESGFGAWLCIALCCIEVAKKCWKKISDAKKPLGNATTRDHHGHWSNPTLPQSPIALPSPTLYSSGKTSVPLSICDTTWQ